MGTAEDGGDKAMRARVQQIRQSNHDLRNTMFAAVLRGSALRRRSLVARAELRAVASETVAAVRMLLGTVALRR